MKGVQTTRPRGRHSAHASPRHYGDDWRPEAHRQDYGRLASWSAHPRRRTMRWIDIGIWIALGVFLLAALAIWFAAGTATGATQ